MVSPEEDAKYVGENVGKSQSGMSKLEISTLSTSGTGKTHELKRFNKVVYQIS